MKIYKPKLSLFIRNFFLNFLASFVFLLVVGNFIDMIFGFIATFFVYTYLMYLTFIKDRKYFTLEDNIFRQYQGRKMLFEYDIRNYKVNKEISKGFAGYSKITIMLGNHIIDCQMLDLDTFEELYQDLKRVK